MSMAKPIVWALNYHEVLSDPRVFKEAKTVASECYDVIVFCDRPKGLDENGVKDGVKIRRFECFSTKGFSKEALEIVNKFKRSSEQSRQLLAPVVRLSERLSKLATVSERSSEILRSPRLYKDIYKGAHGAKRVRLKSGYLAARIALKARTIADRGLYKDVQIWRQRQAIERDLERAFRDVHHASAFVFAHNLLALDVPRPPQIVHAHDLFTLPAAVELKRRYGCKVIYDAHEIETARATKTPKAGREYVDDLERDCLEDVEALITVSDSIGTFYADRFNKAAPTIVMNAPEITLTPEEAVESKRDIRARARVSGETPLLVYTGGIQREHRGLDKVVAALAGFPEVHLATLGARHPSNDAWLRSQAARYGVTERVHLLDGVPAGEVVGTIATATAAIIPIQGVSLSYQLAMPNKLFEAAIARLPILVSDLPDMRRFVEDLGIGIVMDHRSPEGIAEAIRELLSSDPSSWGSEETETKLDAQFSWQAQQKRLLALYRDLSARP